MGLNGKGCTLGRCLCIILCLFSLAAIGGILLWQYLPDDQKATLEAILDNGIPFAGTGGSAPPPSYQFSQCDSSRCCNGLTTNCDRQIDQILLAGVHNAQASTQDGFLLLPNHQFDLISALDYGYRVLNLDIGVCDGQLALVHGVCRLGTVDPETTFARIAEWIKNQPQEVILIPIQIDNAAGGGSVDFGRLYNTMARSGLVEYLYQYETGDDWPTLQTLIDLDQRVLLFHYNGDDVTNPPGFHDWFSHAAETTFAFTSADDVADKETSCAITRGRPTAPFFCLNVFTSVPGQTASRRLGTVEYLNDHIARCGLINRRRVNVVFVDFWQKTNLPQVVQEYNRALA